MDYRILIEIGKSYKNLFKMNGRYIFHTVYHECYLIFFMVNMIKKREIFYIDMLVYLQLRLLRGSICKQTLS